MKNTLNVISTIAKWENLTSQRIIYSACLFIQKPIKKSFESEIFNFGWKECFELKKKETSV